ncbi:hypothetical protein D3C80_693090 [compost metagenome]
MEFHIRLQGERVGEAIVADLEFLGQDRLHIACVGKPEETFIDIVVEGFVDALAGAGRVVQVLRLVKRTDIDRGIRVEIGGLRRSCRQRGKKDRCNRGARACLSVFQG